MLAESQAETENVCTIMCNKSHLENLCNKRNLRSSRSVMMFVQIKLIMVCYYTFEIYQKNS